MSLKRSNSSFHPPIDAANAQLVKKTKMSTSIFLPDDALSRIGPYVDSETLPALSCAGATTHDTAVFRDVANGSFLLMPTTERHFVELAKKDGYNAYFQDYFASSTHSEVCPHLKCGGSRSSATSAR